MSTYIIHKSEVDVVGTLWMGGTGATTYNLDSYDVENAKDEVGNLTQESVERWVMLHSGDFQGVKDFRASLWDGKRDHDFPFKDEENELTFNDCMYPCED